MLLTFEQPMSARGGAIDPGQVRPLGVQSERGYLEVVSPLQVKFDVRKAAGGLLKLDPLELPAEFQMLSGSPALAVYQYTGRPFRLEMGVEWYAQAETADQIVDFAKLSSQVSRDGQVVTNAQYFVKTRGRKRPPPHPAGGTQALGNPGRQRGHERAQMDGEETLIPLPARVEPERAGLRGAPPRSARGGLPARRSSFPPRGLLVPAVIWPSGR